MSCSPSKGRKPLGSGKRCGTHRSLAPVPKYFRFHRSYHAMLSTSLPAVILPAEPCYLRRPRPLFLCLRWQCHPRPPSVDAACTLCCCCRNERCGCDGVGLFLGVRTPHHPRRRSTALGDTCLPVLMNIMILYKNIRRTCTCLPINSINSIIFK